MFMALMPRNPIRLSDSFVPEDRGLVHVVNGKVTERMRWVRVGGTPGSRLVADEHGGVWTRSWTAGLHISMPARSGKWSWARQVPVPEGYLTFRGRSRQLPTAFRRKRGHPTRLRLFLAKMPSGSENGPGFTGTAVVLAIALPEGSAVR